MFISFCFYREKSDSPGGFVEGSFGSSLHSRDVCVEVVAQSLGEVFQ